MGSKKRENDDYKRRRTKKIGENDKRDWEKAGERDKFLRRIRGCDGPY